ncbi:F-box-like protein [Ceratobasidium sp. AG-Ba]|nr:F-box-like protein [Ceratobasidium sp. AG-Ba]
MAEDELARFREQWKEEVRARTTGEPVASTSEGGPSTSQPSRRRSPVEIYAEAVEKEQRGQLDEALTLYRRAFRLDANVDKAWELQNTTKALHSLTLAPVESTTTIKHPVQLHINVPQTSSHSIRTLITNFPPTSELLFAPEIEQEPVHLTRIPDELLLHILKLSDVPTIERFALVCRRARVLTLDPDLWRDFVTNTYITPQIPEDALLGDAITRFGGDLRRLYIELPRVRIDGVYIAVCHYSRAGQSENAWVNVDHLVTYHRYLRFLPDGRVLSLLDQNLEPQEAVNRLEPGLRIKGFFIGTWTLNTETDHPHVTLNNLSDPTGKFGHSFKMDLTLGSRPLGR